MRQREMKTKNSVIMRWMRRSCWKFWSIWVWYFIRSLVGFNEAFSMKAV